MGGRCRQSEPLTLRSGQQIELAPAFDAERAGGQRRVTNTCQRYDLQGGPVRTFFVGDTQSLQESGFVPRKGSTEEGDGYVMGIASNFAEMASELHIVDAQRMEEGAVAVVKLPFRLRSGTHVNWFSAAELADQQAAQI